MSRILGGSAARLEAGKASPRVRETSSAVVHVVKGSGYSQIGEEKFNWVEGDTFCIPAWYPYQHFASDGAGSVYLYRFDDKPMLRSLGFYRSSDMDIESLVSS